MFLYRFKGSLKVYFMKIMLYFSGTTKMNYGVHKLQDKRQNNLAGSSKQLLGLFTTLKVTVQNDGSKSSQVLASQFFKLSNFVSSMHLQVHVSSRVPEIFESN